ncbi:OmpA family protein [Alteraurantiacibacter aquimixticola]|nr:OmpA family protein [Alteraurantiacibacter aquimixticola]
MRILKNPRIALAAGAAAMVALAIIGGNMTGPALADRLAERTVPVVAEAGGGNAVEAQFRSPNGLASRHPLLVGGEGLDDSTRARIARAVAAIPGVGGIRWADGTMLSEGEAPPLRPLHCQEDVQALLRARSIRFEEGSDRLVPGSEPLVDEVATALRPCLGAIIEITGHTDSSGTEPGNLSLSRERAAAVRNELVERGIPADGLRIRGVGSRLPVEGLDPADPANRRIEFTVLETEPIMPTPVDTPGPR